jgi:RNA polymerase sigma-70 factor (ECF subfamily)
MRLARGGRRYSERTVNRSAQADRELVVALRAGDEAAFAWLVDDLSPRLLRAARLYVSTDAAAQEVVQETWLGVLKGLDGFEGRAALKTWIFRILMNIAKTRGVRDSRSLPFSSAFDSDSGGYTDVVDPDRFLAEDHARWPGHWAIGPTPWPEQAAETAEALRLIRSTVEALPGAQREVMTLCDIVGCSAEETCNALGLTETNQRVLLHRARAKVRTALERELDATEPTL